MDVCDLKSQCSLYTSDFDDLLDSFGQAAQELIEDQTGRILASCTWTVYLDEFPDEYFYFSNGPVTAISSIEYLVDGVWAAVDSGVYLLGKGSKLSQGVVKVDGQSWPTGKDQQAEAVRINYTAGEENHRANQAIKLLVAHWFANREAVIIGTISSDLPLAVKTIVNSLKNWVVR